MFTEAGGRSEHFFACVRTHALLAGSETGQNGPVHGTPDAKRHGPLPEEAKEPRLSLLHGGKIFEISAKRF